MSPVPAKYKWTQAQKVGPLVIRTALCLQAPFQRLINTMLNTIRYTPSLFPKWYRPARIWEYSPLHPHCTFWAWSNQGRRKKSHYNKINGFNFLGILTSSTLPGLTLFISWHRAIPSLSLPWMPASIWPSAKGGSTPRPSSHSSSSSGPRLLTTESPDIFPLGYFSKDEPMEPMELSVFINGPAIKKCFLGVPKSNYCWGQIKSGHVKGRGLAIWPRPKRSREAVYFSKLSFL